jgi:nitric oxide reductase NorQ protein
MVNQATVIRLEPGKDFVVTPFVESVCRRCLTYLKAGYPVHLSGPAGTGKTTLAMHLAGLLGRPVMIIYGDEEFGSSDLLGSDKGIIAKKLVDNFVHTVIRTEENVSNVWVDQRLTTVCKNGYTLVYDEFSRSRAEANNVLLSALEERLLVLPEGKYGESYINIHPEFRAIFTSNPDEYAGVYTPQSALLDRMITIHLGCYDVDTETAIAAAKSGLTTTETKKVVELVRFLRESPDYNIQPTIRASIMIADIASQLHAKIRPDDKTFNEICIDILCNGSDENSYVQNAMEAVFGSNPSILKL